MSLREHGSFRMLTQEIFLCLNANKMSPATLLGFPQTAKQSVTMSHNICTSLTYCLQIMLALPLIQKRQRHLMMEIFSSALYCLWSQHLLMEKRFLHKKKILSWLLVSLIETTCIQRSSQLAALNGITQDNPAIAAYTSSTKPLKSQRITRLKLGLSFLSVFNSVDTRWNFATSNPHSKQEHLSFVA